MVEKIDVTGVWTQGKLNFTVLFPTKNLGQVISLRQKLIFIYINRKRGDQKLYELNFYNNFYNFYNVSYILRVMFLSLPLILCACCVFEVYSILCTQEWLLELITVSHHIWFWGSNPYQFHARQALPWFPCNQLVDSSLSFMILYILLNSLHNY